MTTPTTNYGWLKPQATEKANIAVINTMMDDVDTDMKSVETTNSTKIYPMGQYRVKRKFTLIGDGLGKSIVSSEPDLWEEEWYAPGNVGGWTFAETGLFRFTAAGIYRLTYNFTVATYGTSTTSGTVSVAVHEYSSGNLINRSKTYVRSNTTDNVTNFMRTTMTGSFYLWAGTGSDQCTLNNDYNIVVQHTTTAGTINMIFSPNDLGVFRTQLTLECVRYLAS